MSTYTDTTADALLARICDDYMTDSLASFTATEETMSQIDTDQTFTVYAYDVEGEIIAHPYQTTYDNLIDAISLARRLYAAVQTTYSVQVDSVSVVRRDREWKRDGMAPYCEETDMEVFRLPVFPSSRPLV